MTISAKYETKCPTCSKMIHTGESVEWTKGSKARHTTCVNVSTWNRSVSTVRGLPAYDEAAAENAEAILAMVEMHEDNPAYRNYDLDDYSYDVWVRR